MIIGTAKELDYGVLQIGENYIEIKLIGGIFVDELENNNFNIELQLKNDKYKRFKVIELVKNTIVESWLKETERRHKETLRCVIPKVEFAKGGFITNAEQYAGLVDKTNYFASDSDINNTKGETK